MDQKQKTPADLAAKFTAKLTSYAWLTASVLLALVAVLNIVAFFFLPTSMAAGPAAQRIPTVRFLAGGILLVGVCGIMAVFGPKPKKWLAMEVAMTLFDLALVGYQFI